MPAQSSSQAGADTDRGLAARTEHEGDGTIYAIGLTTGRGRFVHCTLALGWAQCADTSRLRDVYVVSCYGLE